ncbi:MAG: hypothetical protein AAB215_08525, partial [Planctomycetota bacterium]
MRRSVWRISLLLLVTATLCSRADQPTNVQVKITLPDAAVYEGGIKDGLLEGHGVLIYPNGDRFEGEYRRGLLSGVGVSVGGHGGRYDGEFRDGEYDGTGVLLHRYGDRYEGHFEKGVFAGQGKHLASDGYRFEGTFKNWRLEGTGVVHGASGLVETGEFKNGLLDGRGRRTYSEGFVEEGLFEKGRLEGKGVLVYSGGDRYEGEFKAGLPSGHGVRTYANGDRFEGEFKDGKPLPTTGRFPQLSASDPAWLSPRILPQPSERVNAWMSPFILLVLGVSLLLNLFMALDRARRGRFQPRLERVQETASFRPVAGAERFETIAVLDNEVQAEAVDAVLAERGIPHGMISYHDSAFNRVFESKTGWGYVEAPKALRDEVLKAIKDLAGPPPD